MQHCSKRHANTQPFSVVSSTSLGDLALFCIRMFGELQEATIHTQQTQHTEADTKLKGQLQSAQDHIAQLEVQLATASEAASRTQLAQSLQLKKLSEQHSSMLSQLRCDHEFQLKAATEHHEVQLCCARMTTYSA